MIGSWAGAMGHTQWMPEVWLHDRRRLRQRRPRHAVRQARTTALAGTARYLVERGKYRRGEAWGCEVDLPARRRASPTTAPCALTRNGTRSASRAPTAQPSPRPHDKVKLWLPVARRAGVPGRAEFPRGLFVQPVDRATRWRCCHLGDLIRGDPPLRAAISRRRAAADAGRGQGNPAPPQRARLQDRRHRRPHRQRHRARPSCAFQKKVGMEPADGYAGLKVLARLRQGS